MDKGKALCMASIFSLILLPMVCAKAKGSAHYRAASDMWRSLSSHAVLVKLNESFS